MKWLRVGIQRPRFKSFHACLRLIKSRIEYSDAHGCGPQTALMGQLRREGCWATSWGARHNSAPGFRRWQSVFWYSVGLRISEGLLTLDRTGYKASCRA